MLRKKYIHASPYYDIWGFPQMGIPWDTQNGWFIRAKPSING
jgi:hypothetical protein